MNTSSPAAANFDQFVGQLHAAIELPTAAKQLSTVVPLLLDGAAADAAKTLLPLHYRRRHGIFFSGHEIATLVAKQLGRELAAGATVFDPACGAGDLLLAAARHMPLKRTQIDTIRAWTRAIGGCDIHGEFVVAARMRLLLLVRMRHMERGDNITAISLQTWMFDKIHCTDFLLNNGLGREYSCIIANPPFGDIDAPAGCKWSTGKTQLAAVFLEAILASANARQHVIAILPDVLRSGTRYGRWRERVATRSTRIIMLPYGRFDGQTDVDVFILEFHINERDQNARQQWPSFSLERENFGEKTRLMDNFDVRIGPVVPHRHGNCGKWVAYLCVKTANPFSEITATKKRRFKGTLFTPPFVVVRRTSNPADTQRIIPTIVTGLEPVAIENHLIVILPKKGGIKACRYLYEQLITENTRAWIDSAIRCRHLTKQVLLKMPIGTFEYE